jgi:cell division protein FtsB
MQRRRQIVWASVVMALLLAVSSFAGEGGFRRYWRLRQDLRTLHDRNARLTDENAKLRREVQAMQDDPAALERAAREELGFVRPGEIVFTLEGP